MPLSPDELLTTYGVTPQSYRPVAGSDTGEA